MTDIDKYLSFVLTTFMAFGVTFEVPVVVVVLVRVGLVSIDKLKEIRPYVIVGAFVVGAIFTPPDVISQVMLAVPLWFLYELGIVCARVVGRFRLRPKHPRAQLGQGPQAAGSGPGVADAALAPATLLGGRLPTATWRSTSLLSRRSRTEAGLPGTSAAPGSASSSDP